MAEPLHDPNVLPDDLPVPQDDGAARHLTGFRLPVIALTATDGAPVNLSKLKGRTVVYVYPRTGRPGQELPTGWNAIPGARGCTPQSCGFRDHFAELKQLGVDALYGLSTQDGAYQREVAERLHLPFAILSYMWIFALKHPLPFLLMNTLQVAILSMMLYVISVVGDA